MPAPRIVLVRVLAGWRHVDWMGRLRSERGLGQAMLPGSYGRPDMRLRDRRLQTLWRFIYGQVYGKPDSDDDSQEMLSSDHVELEFGVSWHVIGEQPCNGSSPLWRGACI